jgi:hypothetical protein
LRERRVRLPQISSAPQPRWKAKTTKAPRVARRPKSISYPAMSTIPSVFQKRGFNPRMETTLKFHHFTTKIAIRMKERHKER